MKKENLISGLIASLVFIAGCPAEAPVLLPIGNREVVVGQTLEIHIAAQTSEPRILEFAADHLPSGSQLFGAGPTQARFVWSPTAANVGVTYIEFTVSGGRQSDSETVRITVRGEGHYGPEFVGPSTWTLEVYEKSIERVIEVRDSDASNIEWRIDNAPQGSTFTPHSLQTVFFWEPTPTQRTQPQYTFTVTATNQLGQQASRVFTILIRDGGGGQGCPSDRPRVDTTTPSFVHGANDFEVTALAYVLTGQITSVTLQWWKRDTSSSPDYSFVQMSPDGQGTYRASVRLPEDLEPGSYAIINYVVCALGDQGEGCEQESCTPLHSFTAQRRGGQGLCSDCGSSAECGTENDLCLAGVRPGEKFCGLDCRATDSCPIGYECITVGVEYRQCFPVEGTCEQSSFRRAEPGEIVINEVLPAPPAGVDVNGDGIASTRGDEFVELVSVANVPVDIGGFTISDRVQVRYSFPMGTVLPPGDAIVVFGGGDPTTFTADFGEAQVLSVHPNNPDGHGLALRDAGDEVIVRDPDLRLVAAMEYGDVRMVAPENRYSLTLEPQVSGIVYVPFPEAPGSRGARFSPGRQSCGRAFPAHVFGDCGGRTCGGRIINADQEPNDTRYQASCIHGQAVEIEGNLAYHGTNSPTHPGPNPVDYYVFHASQGDTLDIVTFPCDSTDPLRDSYIELLDASGGLIVANDDYAGASPFLFAELHDYSVTETGTYYLVVRTFQGASDDIGCYVLWLLITE